MKKLLLLIIVSIISFSLFGCTFIEDDNNSGEDNSIKTVSFTVNFDYETCVQTSDGQPILTKLLDYSLVFFNPSDYGIKNLVAGDCIEMQYTGNLMIAETYPGHVDTRELKIISIKQYKAGVFEYKVKKVENGFIFFENKNDKINEIKVEIGNKKLITKGEKLEDFSSDLVGQTLYCTDRAITSVIDIAGIYSYNPHL